MKRLKYLHPFAGKVFPLHIMGAAFIVGIFLPLKFDFGDPAVCGIVLSLAAGAIMSVILHIHDEHDKDAIANASYPLWNPLPDKMLANIRQTEQLNQISVKVMLMIAGGIGGVIFVLMLLPNKHDTSLTRKPEQAFTIALMIGSVAFGVILALQFRSRIWEQIDETAVYTKIPIDHFYDVTHHGKRGEKWIVSYIVFYLPDGKYIIKAKEGSGWAENVTVVRFRSMIRCMTLRENNP